MEKGILKQARTSGKGAGSFMVAKEEKPKKVTKPKKPVAKKSKPAAKKATPKKQARKSVKKPIAKKAGKAKSVKAKAAQRK